MRLLYNTYFLHLTHFICYQDNKSILATLYKYFEELSLSEIFYVL